ncbi:unnamed protein product [Vitrella brassicaformis CCMP3155]|uniref:RING-CH-type domain-containing protein n=1 Tax=Vitrella brassicaformis (strain CCMP3155) TaxID=1169540 RepID=A0A0G4G6M9_VITBC|nr:unnamed protein product [Vitrella brassicaformis CCMP3155]|eukprot:CEM24018.1 unnamed protein product [Vitrella brassicaformis CCMP3155]
MEDQKCFICWGGSAEGILEKPCKCRIAHRECLEKWRTISQDPTRCEICRSVYPTVAPLAATLPSLRDLWDFVFFRLMVPIYCATMLLTYAKGFMDGERMATGHPVCVDPVWMCSFWMQHPDPYFRSGGAKVCLGFPYDAFRAAYGEYGAAYGEYGLKFIDATKHALSRFLMAQALPELVVLFASPFLFKPPADVAPQLPNPIYGIMTIRKLLHTIPPVFGWRFIVWLAFNGYYAGISLQMAADFPTVPAIPRSPFQLFMTEALDGF